MMGPDLRGLGLGPLARPAVPARLLRETPADIPTFRCPMRIPQTGSISVTIITPQAVI